jgi:hypothetical protein
VERKAAKLMLDDGSDFNYTASSTEDQKQNIADRMRSWRMNTGVLGMFIAPSV